MTGTGGLAFPPFLFSAALPFLALIDSPVFQF